MKHIFVLPGLLLLAACSSVGEANRIGGNYTMNEYQNMRVSNTKVTGLAQTATNRAEIVEYAKKVGVVVVANNTSPASESISRPAMSGGHVKPGHSTESSDRDKVAIFNTQYATAQKAFENLYKIYTNEGFKGLSNLDVKNAYLIAGGNAEDYSWNADMTDVQKQAIVDFISARAETLLDTYFDRDPDNSDAWIIKNRSQDLSDINLISPSGTDTLTFILDEHGEIIGINDSDTQYTRLSRNNAAFQRRDATKEYTDVTTISLNTFGAANKLSYADFGLKAKNITRTFNDSTKEKTSTTTRSIFAGGYDLKKINRETINSLDTEMNFDGTAIGVVTAADEDKSQIIVAGNAVLNFKNGTETLTAAFNGGSTAVEGETKWYHMEYTNNGTDSAMTFTKNGDIDEKYQLSNLTPTDNYDVKFEYYGDKGTPSEFVGTATYNDANGVSMDAAFGGTLIKPQTE